MVYALFINTVHRSHKSLYLEKIIKNKTHGTIHIFKNYFVIVFSISVKIGYPNGPLMSILFKINWPRRNKLNDMIEGRICKI